MLCTGLALLGIGLASAAWGSEQTTPPESEKFRNGYSAGYAFGNHLAKLQDQDIALQAVLSGILDALSGTAPRLSPETMQATLKALEHHTESRAANNRRPGIRVRPSGDYDDFATLNARREGVVTLPSGVQYEVLQAGTGRKPGQNDTVRVNYKGSLATGVVFDTTYEDKEPASLKIADIAAPGLKQALLLMNEGAKWRVVIPPKMGFGRSGNNQLRRRDLIYEIELVSVEAGNGDSAPE
jgi:FKBP-type peptidyl-prolyl cis-trans isomerase FklB